MSKLFTLNNQQINNFCMDQSWRMTWLKKKRLISIFCEGETKKLMPHIAKQVEILGNDKSKHTRDV